RLQRLARGEGSRPLVPTDAPLHFEEAMELEHPLETLEPLAFVLNRMLESLCARLQARALATNEPRLRMELDSSPPCPEFMHMVRLPVPMLDAKVFLKLLQLDLEVHPPQAPIRKIFL